MNLLLERAWTVAEATLGGLTVDDRFQCFSLEDVGRAVKIPGETRIPAGEYEIKLRTEGRVHEKYAQLYPEHRGVLWLQDVPGFEWIYIHVGNTKEDTDGCILLGDTLLAAGRLADSVVAYRRVYGIVSNAILAGELVVIRVEDRWQTTSPVRS